ncbi:MAG: hypothetical protein WAS27_01600 [Candidatus Saccharimonadales bacterium]
MGLFQHKEPVKTPRQKARTEVKELFDEAFRDELREHGRLYFERVINENAALFKQDLDATVAHINTELKQHLARQLDQRFADIAKENNKLKEHISKELETRMVEYDKTIKDAEELALQSLNQSAQALHDQHQELARAVHKTVAEQEAKLAAVFAKNATQVASMESAQQAALDSLTSSVKALEEQHTQLGTLLEQTIAAQKTMMVDAFEQNMARVIEHYILGALGEEYDMKAQLPVIIKQLEANKQAMADDMKL